MIEDNATMISYRTKRAFESLVEAEDMLKLNHYHASINRIYYSCFYIVIALLLKSDFNPTTHKGARQLFNLHFVKPEIVQLELGKFYSLIYENRQKGDYDDFIEFDKETVLELLNTAKDFVNEINRIIQEA